MSALEGPATSPSRRGRIAFRTALLMLCWLGCQAAETCPALAVMSAEDRHRFQCLGCHTAGDKIFIDAKTGEQKEIGIDIAAMRAADHGNLACQECHVKGFNIFPHFGKKILGCMECHPRQDAAADDEPYDFPRIEREFESTIHYTRHPQEFDCAQCHHPHYFMTAAELGSPQAILDTHNAWCLTCHAANPQQPPDTIATGLADPAEPDLLAEHAAIPHAAIHLRKARCVDCHSGTEHTVSHTLPARGAAGDCGSCHSLESVHARLYRYVREVHEPPGFSNPAMMRDSYVMAATRYVPLDVFAYVLVGASVLAALAHAAMRAIWRLAAMPAGGKKRVDQVAQGAAGPSVTGHPMRPPLWLRLWHWMTALSFILLIITGVILHFREPVGALISYHSATTVHDIIGIFMSALYGAHLVFLIRTGYWRQYVPSGEKFWDRVKAQVIFYTVGWRRSEIHAAPAADGRFNALQQLTYLIVVFALLPLLVVTGLLYLNYPAFVPETVLGLTGVWPLALAHYALGIAGAAYLVVHVYMASVRPNAGR